MAKRVARGHLNTPGGEAARAVAVDLLMAALQEEYPAAITQLWEAVSDPAAWLDKAPPHLRRSGTLGLVLVASPELETWATQWHLKCDLVYSWVQWSLDRLRPYSNRATRPGATTTIPPSFWSSWRGHTAEDRTDLLAPVGAMPDLETREQFELRVENHWQARVNALVSAGQGYTVAPLKTNPDHFRWFVRYQCGRQESMSAIARSVNRELNTVHGAIKTTAKLLRLKLRPPAKGGRPRRTP